jgi:hypothetical protein
MRIKEVILTFFSQLKIENSDLSELTLIAAFCIF